MAKFTIALREIGTYKEVLQSQVVILVLLMDTVDIFVIALLSPFL